MALQGTIDAFALTDVLQLLSSSAKSGRLRLDGDRGVAELWLDEGSVIGGGPSGNTAAELLVALLRFRAAGFTFDVVDGRPTIQVEPVALDVGMQQADQLLQDWVRIEALVPTMRHRARPVPTIAEPQVTLSAAEWSLLMSLEAGRSVVELMDCWGRGEHATATAVAGLVERGLCVIEAPAVSDGASGPDATERSQDRTADDEDAAPVGADGATTRPARAVDPEADTSPPSGDERGRDTAADDPPTDSGIEGFVPFDAGRESWITDDPEPFAAAQTLMAYEPEGRGSGLQGGDRSVDPAAVAESERLAGGRQDEDQASEVLRQMSSLSPKAAEAIAAALNTGGASVGEPGASDDRPSGFLGTL